MKKIGLIGLGKQGFEHLEVQHLCQHSRITHVYDAFQKEVALPAGVQRCDELKQLLEQPLDGIVVAVPHHQYRYILDDIWRVKPGINVAKEKPLGRNIAEANEFMQMAKMAKANLRTLIQRRHHASYAALRQLIRDEPTKPVSITMHLHLGFDRPETIDSTSWRNSKKDSGGGALLDCGYHLIDLALHLIGDFEVVACTLWQNNVLIDADQIDDRVHLVGVANDTWLDIQSSVYDDYIDSQSIGKFEQVTVTYADKRFVANRSEVWLYDDLNREGTRLFEGDKNWQQAMIEQLDNFAMSLDETVLPDDDALWDQQPALSIIDSGYGMANLWDGSNG